MKPTKKKSVRMVKIFAWAIVDKSDGFIFPNSYISDSFSYSRQVLVDKKAGFAHPRDWRICQVKIEEVK